jgi:glycosyltransferase involved in cell wall biosynthesis
MTRGPLGPVPGPARALGDSAASRGALGDLALSVIVPTRNRPDRLAGCLDSIVASLRPGDELIVVDSASTTDGIREVAEARGALYLRCDRPGAARARNAGWRHARHDIVAFIDDDVRVAPGWAMGMAAGLSAHPEAAFMTGRLEVPPEESSRRPVALKDDVEAHVLDFDYAGDTPGHSANLAAWRSALEAVNGFDERFGAGADFRGAEDLDLFDRMYAAGLVGRYEPAANGWHQQWREKSELIKLDWNYGIGMGAHIAKQLRLNRHRARTEMRVMFWDWGVREMIFYGRRRDRFMTATATVRVLGAIAGLARGLPVRVREGHFARRRS